MGYLATWLDWTTIDIAEYAKETTTYSAYYYFWRDELFGRVMRLFKEKTDPIPSKEIEIRLMMQGHCGIAPIKGNGELTAFWGAFNGVSKYFDEKPFYTVRCPIWSQNLKVGRDIEVIDNNILRNPLYDLIHHYATILAHTEVTYIMSAVEARNPKGVPVATTEKQKTSIKNFLTKIFNGKFDVVTDIGNLGIEYVGAHTNVTQGVEELWNARERILASFLSDIGVKTGIDKRSNSVSDEINADTPSLLVNLDDMLNSRKEGFERVNKHFGTNWTVELNENIDYINMFTDPQTDTEPDTGKEQEDVQSN